MLKKTDKDHLHYRETRDFGEDRRDWIRTVIADGELESNYRLIAVAIAMRMNHRSEESYPGTKRIAEDTATSLRTVIRAINKLEGEGYLKVTHRKRGVNRYEMLLPWK